jgi:hypothetical protein
MHCRHGVAELEGCTFELDANCHRSIKTRVGTTGETPTASQGDAVMVSPSPQPKNTTDGSIDMLQKYACDFRCQHTIDTDNITYDSDDEDHGLAIGCLVVT